MSAWFRTRCFSGCHDVLPLHCGKSKFFPQGGISTSLVATLFKLQLTERALCFGGHWSSRGFGAAPEQAARLCWACIASTVTMRPARSRLLESSRTAGISLRVPVAERIVGEGNLKTAPPPPRLSNTRCVFEKTTVTRLRELWQVCRCVPVPDPAGETLSFWDNIMRRNFE